ncbi:DnaB-like helicase C-terminal domain-containing protein [Paenibacillus sp. NPDC058071]|uniref:DnaB-like helicase C-terminal domain-containing protein n=1 Tax=Paenibacillus sp. NPDC058071 TaxID=3346326 RepID=UPI0036DEFEE9
MIEELQLINYWLTKKEPAYLQKLGMDRSYFIVLRDIVEWIERFRDSTGQLPTIELAATEHEDFQILRDLDPEPYLVNSLKEQRAYMDFRPLYVEVGNSLNEGADTIDQMRKMRTELETLLKGYDMPGLQSVYDWASDAQERYERYMKTHKRSGLAGYSYGIRALDEATGGIRNDDNILLAGRMGEGKSLIGSFFAYQVWQSVQAAGLNAPVIYISTEMPEAEISYRLDSMKGHFSNRGLNEGKLSDHTLYREYLDELSKRDGSFKIITTETFGDRSITVQDIRSVMESERPAFMVIDQLYDIMDGTGESDIRRRIVKVSSAIREANKSLGVPVLNLAQAGRGAAKEAHKNEKATPELEDIQESDHPAQKATRVITIRKLDQAFKLTLKKNRAGERNKDVYMRADIDRGFWEEIDENEVYF